MELSRISSKGQVTIPKVIRRQLQLNDGDHVAFIEQNGRIYITKANVTTEHEKEAPVSENN